MNESNTGFNALIHFEINRFIHSYYKYLIIPLLQLISFSYILAQPYRSLRKNYVMGCYYPCLFCVIYAVRCTLY